MQGTDILNTGTSQMRTADKDLLSLALIEARNQTLRWVNVIDAAQAEMAVKAAKSAPGAAEVPVLSAAAGRGSMAHWEFGHIGWFQEHGIARNLQRQQGARAGAARLGSILADADACFDPAEVPPAHRATLALPPLQTLRQYLVDTLETTLDLLAATPAAAAAGAGVAGVARVAQAGELDDALHFFRRALFHEDARREVFAELAQTLGIDARKLFAQPLMTMAPRPPLLFPATRWRLGSEPGGFVFDNEQWAHDVALVEFEIDAQPVNWAQYGEFVKDGGYDERAHWSDAGWAWVQAQGRRTPRHVEQMRQGVLLHRFGQLVRAPLAQAVVHVSWYEAQAWCHWAGRRLPSEAEWEAAAVQGASRGMRWGEVWEWTSNTFRAYPGAAVGDALEAVPRKVQRGASFATSGRLRHPKARRGRAAEDDGGFYGFRSCGV